MIVIKDLSKISKFPYPVVVMGNFDGVHAGHQKMIQETVLHAKKNKGTSIVITYEPNTKVFFGIVSENDLLQTPEQKLKSLEDLGVDVVIVLHFTKELSQMMSGDFIENILINTIGIKEIIIGYDTVFGRDKKGNKESLVLYGKKYNFSVTVVEPVLEGDKVISSSSLRK